MSLFGLVCVLTPSVPATLLFERWVSGKLDRFSFLKVYLSMLAVINMIPLLFVTYILKHHEYGSWGILFNVGFSAKYLLCSLAAAVAIPWLVGIYCKKIKLSMESEGIPEEAPDGAPEHDEENK